MAGRWSSEQVVAEYRDLQASAMAVDHAGQLALLAGRRALAIVQLNKPTEIVKKIPRNSKWEISAAQWNPHPSHGHLFVTASNQRADLWSWNGVSSCTEPQESLKAHTRVISDMDWSPKEPTIIATCSVDTYTFLWDTRDVRKPSVALQAVAGASQVKWNKVNSNLLATTHDGDIRIWDPRKGTSPVQYIAAHLSKIHGLDWSPDSEFHLATSSQDSTVKFWDVTNPKQPVIKLPSPSPVWRARYTPFGQGLVSVVVPQLRRGENSLFLWSLSKEQRQSAVHTFVGHTDVVLEFQWRRPDDDCNDYQLVTWSKDQSLRLWRIDSNLQKVFLPSPTVTLEEDVTDSPLVSEPVKIPQTITAKENETATPPTLTNVQRDNGHSPINQPRNLMQEFRLVNFNIANVKMDPIKRTCTVSTVSGPHIVLLSMHFPTSYPDKEPPSFQFGKATTLDVAAQTKLIKVLCDTAKQHVNYNRSCIEPCLRQLVASLEALTATVIGEEANPFQPPQTHRPPNFLPIFNYSAILDQGIPFPRTSGARFCGVGVLVCFSRRSEHANLRRTSSSIDATPRSMSTLSAFSQTALTPQGQVGPPMLNLFNLGNMASMARSPPTDNSVSLAHFYNYKDRLELRQRSKPRLRDATDHRRDVKVTSKVSPVAIYDVSCLLPVHRTLAENYVLDPNDVPCMCRKNASVAASVGREDLVQMWSLAALANDKNLTPDLDPEKGSPWALHPFGRKMLKSILLYYASIRDVQTLAMLCCTFGTRSDAKASQHVQQIVRSSSRLEESGSNVAVPRMRRSNSCSDVFDDSYRFVEMKDASEKEQEQHVRNMRMLDSAASQQYDHYKRVYADLLFRWGLLNHRALILKYVGPPTDFHKGLECKAQCQHCTHDSKDVQCVRCNKYVLQCSICHITVKGASSFCLLCGHGGHSSHMIAWFREHSLCPTGCGCSCLTAP
ncbi:hypothetical protein CAPTEDRAFT_124558 [Capitella teleta]|uniref:RWD domain-containing protein n=1 Tax=Capitella teleta TaxID=283909 RepID=R7TMI9_CAPTE|nr:hypothetical protein CAPTEDRAFT_124558 [Capitella teleta]|eukprot:ELT94839.1 hypothetical protein CAPTEDRAFT_124558 [Capitella teleta]